jgi:hypothetical protein
LHLRRFPWRIFPHEQLFFKLVSDYSINLAFCL